jgi:hypothetical protein
VNRNLIYLAAMTAIVAAGSAYAQDYNEYGLRRSMTEQELTRYGQCQETVLTMIWPDTMNGKQVTATEALGADIIRHLCACTAVRLRKVTDDFRTVWAGCGQDVIGNKRK